MTLIPLAALFAVPWVIQEGSAPGWTFVVVAAGWLAVVSALQGDRARRWSRGARAGSPGTGVAIAGAATALALLAGGLTGLRGPQGSLDFATGFGTGTGDIRLDALVSLRRSLVENDDRPVITMATTATRPEYLRLAILELFDGEQWSPIGPNDTGPQPPQARCRVGAPRAGRVPAGRRAARRSHAAQPRGVLLRGQRHVGRRGTSAPRSRCARTAAASRAAGSPSGSTSLP